MSKRTLITQLQKELQAINDRIDVAIIRGIPYKNEARRHRELLVLLHRAQEENRSVVVSWKTLFGRSGKSPARRLLVGGASHRMFSVA